MKLSTNRPTAREDAGFRQTRHRRIRFRLSTFLCLIAVIAGGVWLLTQANMRSAEVEILQYDATPVGRTPAGNPDHYLLHHVKFRWHVEGPGMNTATNWFMNPPIRIQQPVVAGSGFKIRYREPGLLFLRAQNPNHEVGKRLQIRPEQIEEVIVESIGSNFEDDW